MHTECAGTGPSAWEEGVCGTYWLLGEDISILVTSWNTGLGLQGRDSQF